MLKKKKKNTFRFLRVANVIILENLDGALSDVDDFGPCLQSMYCVHVFN